MARPCPQCGVEPVADVKFCTACGAAMQAAARPGNRRRATAPATDELQKARGRGEFARIKSTVFAVRGLFLAYACLTLVVGLTLLAARGRIDDDVRTLFDIALVVTGSELVLSLLGGALVLRAPLLWTTVAAGYFTLTTVFAFWADDYAFTLNLGLRLFGVVSMWCGVAQAGRLQQLMAADPTLRMRVGKVAAERRVQGGVADRSRERQRETGRAQWTKRLQLSGVVIAGLVVFGVVLRLLLAPPAVDGAIERFEAAWQASGDAALRQQCEALDGRAADELERRGWTTTRPALSARTVDAQGERATVRWGQGDDATNAVFVRDDRTWRLRQLQLPPLPASDPAAAIEAFRTAWHARGSDGLVGLFRPTARERTGGSLVRLLTKREWHEQRPALGETFPPKPGARGRVRVAFAVAGDQVDVSFEYWHPQWYVVGVSLP